VPPRSFKVGQKYRGLYVKRLSTAKRDNLWLDGTEKDTNFAFAMGTFMLLTAR